MRTVEFRFFVFYFYFKGPFGPVVPGNRTWYDVHETSSRTYVPGTIRYHNSHGAPFPMVGPG